MLALLFKYSQGLNCLKKCFIRFVLSLQLSKSDICLYKEKTENLNLPRIFVIFKNVFSHQQFFKSHHNELPESQTSKESMTKNSNGSENFLALQTQFKWSHTRFQRTGLNLVCHAQFSQLPMVGFAES